MTQVVPTPAPRPCAPGGDGARIRVMIVEDSLVSSVLLADIIRQDPRFDLAGVVHSGEDAIESLGRMKPDAITMDIRLPGIDGLETTRRIMSARPTPIIVVAGDVYASERRLSVDALGAGALCVLEKPGGSPQRLRKFAQELRTQLVIMSQVRLVRRRLQQPRLAPLPSQPARFSSNGPRRWDMLGIVASTGGPNALVEVLSGLCGSFPLPTLIVQHMTSSFSQAFAEWLNDVCPLPVALASNGVQPQPGHVYVAPADRHLRLQGGCLRLDHGPLVSQQRPSGTILLDSMARELGPRAIGVVLTGMGEDGAVGLGAIRAAGGAAIAEHESTAVVYGMPAAAVRLGAAAESLPLGKIAGRIRQLMGERD